MERRGAAISNYDTHNGKWGRSPQFEYDSPSTEPISITTRPHFRLNRYTLSSQQHHGHANS